MPGPKQELGTRISQAEMLCSGSVRKRALPGESWAATGTSGQGIALLPLAEVRVRACPAPSQARCSKDLQGRQKISCEHPLNTQLGFFPFQYPTCLFFPKPACFSPNLLMFPASTAHEQSGLIWLRRPLLGTELSPIHWGVP